MKTPLQTAAIAHRETLRTTYRAPLGIAARRSIPARPLTRKARLSDSSLLLRIARECEGCAVVGYYGHPSRRMAVAYPLPGVDIRTVTAAVKNAAVISGNFTCGNYTFNLSH